MRYAKQKNITRRHFQIGQMDGIDRSSFADEKTLYDAYNLTSDGKPHWKTRPPRGRWHLLNEEQNETNSGVFVLNDPISGACSLEEGLCWTAGTKIYIGGKPLSDVTLQEGDRKQLLPIGKDLFVVPDGVLLHKDTQGVWQKRAAAAHVIINGPMFHMGGCDTNGVKRRLAVVGTSEPAVPYDSYQWVDTSVSPAVLKDKNEAGEWVQLEQDGWFFIFTGLHEKFHVGDYVDITAPGQFYMHNARVFKTEHNAIMVRGDIFADTSEGEGLHIQRRFPVIDHAVVCGNRIWGCRYGENIDGEFVNEIFCSALGDPLTWSRYGTGADDCYCASVGTPGAFTGAAVLYDDIVFFKENSVFCVSGKQPSDFRIAHNEGRGVRAGCERSIARLGSSVVYCGTDGVYRTNGIYTVRLCDGFPPTALENAVGGCIGEKYYLAAHRQNGEKCMFVFTAGRDTYHCEDNAIDVQYFVTQRNSLYMLCIPSTTQIAGISLYWMMICVSDWNAPDKYTNCLLTEGTQESDYGYARETDLRWYALTNELDCGTQATKCIREVAVRFELGESSLFGVELRTDRGECRQLGRFTGMGLRRRILHVSALPCETVQLYFYGHGECTIRDVEIIFENAKGEISRV
ncbi:MAG: hypothetical protein E7523_04710 [Ruminococcaceae bacterium]|nr:hypothetical protein [Oscillospiraceae bacterium]